MPSATRPAIFLIMRVSSTFSTHRSLPIARISFCAASSRADFSPVPMPTSTSSWRTDAHRPLPTVILFAGGAAKAASAPPRPAPPTGRRGFAKASMGSTPPARCSPGAAEGTARAPPAPCWPPAPPL
ncbi:unnamed protein product [Pelagomonas calceolata]|uniref:Uncharacterized protein n=1 Tax=Pelagomonas calceolata TaxID=35677 RepID=A0A8J2WS49_9STRA|nr:unnamed protein product [Pelagomonas calceolata]